MSPDSRSAELYEHFAAVNAIFPITPTEITELQSYCITELVSLQC